MNAAINGESSRPDQPQNQAQQESHEAAKRKRFSELDDNELDQLVNDARSKSTKYATSYAVSIFQGEYNLYITKVDIISAMKLRVFV